MKAAPYATGFFAAALLLASALPARGQIDDSRWLPFIGCWEPVAEGSEGGLLCFRPADGGVEMTSLAAGEVVSTEQLLADGQRRPVVAEGCEGSESVSFSEDGRRAFTRSEFVCGGDSRLGTGVMAVVAPNRWIDVRALDVQGERVTWVLEYGLVGLDRLSEEGIDDPQEGFSMSVRPARMAAATEIDLDDVTEAVERIDSEAVVAWIVAHQDRFDFDGDELLRLADSGVPESVIDVVVAVSYPERFVVAPERAIAEADPGFEGRRIPISVGYGYSPFGFGYSPYGYGRSRFGYGYSSFGYGYGYGSGYGYGGYIPTVVRVERRQVESGGRVVNRRGYSSGSRGGGRIARQGGSSSTGAASAGSGGSRASSGGRRAKRRGGD